MTSSKRSGSLVAVLEHSSSGKGGSESPTRINPSERVQLSPILAMVCRMAVEDPRPITIMAMTAETPMTIPSVVRAARMTFRRRPVRAVRRVLWASTSEPSKRYRLPTVLSSWRPAGAESLREGVFSASTAPSRIRITRYREIFAQL
jgi:hypothetical protein